MALAVRLLDYGALARMLPGGGFENPQWPFWGFFGGCLGLDVKFESRV